MRIITLICFALLFACCQGSGKKAGPQGVLPQSVGGAVGEEVQNIPDEAIETADSVWTEQPTDMPAAGEAAGFTLPADKYRRITAEEAERAAPHLAAWLDYYGLDLNTAFFERQTEFDLWQQDDPNSIRYLPFTDGDDRGYIPGYEYSPNRMRYIDNGGWWQDEEGRFFHDGWDDSQNVYLYDRRYRIVKTAAWMGASGVMDGAFWIDDNTFILSGYDHYTYDFIPETYTYKSVMIYFFHLYDIPGRSIRTYLFFPEDGEVFSDTGYFGNVAVPAKQAEEDARKK